MPELSIEALSMFAACFSGIDQGNQTVHIIMKFPMNNLTVDEQLNCTGKQYSIGANEDAESAT